MKIGKTLKKAKIENPFRPVFGHPRKHTVCKISFRKNFDFPEYCYTVDADQEPLYFGELFFVVPAVDRYYDAVLELHYIKEDHKEFAIDTAKTYFDEIIVIHEDGTKETFKTTVNVHLPNRQG